MNPEQWLSLKWNGGSTMSDRWLNQSKIIHLIYFNNIKYHLWHPLYGCLFSILRIFTIYHILNFTYLPQESKLFKKGFINIFLYYEAFSF